MKKYKAIITEEPMGTLILLYKKNFFGWGKIGGYLPLTSAYFLIDEALERWKKLYGENLTIIDQRFKT